MTYMADKEKIRNVWSVVEGIIWVILMVGMLCWVLSSCGSPSSNKGYGYDYEKTNQNGTSVMSGEERYDRRKMDMELTMPSSRPGESMFMVVERNSHFVVFSHKETGVCYIYRYEGGICPMYNSDGSLYLYRRW